jgi:hypothetical protein
MKQGFTFARTASDDAEGQGWTLEAAGRTTCPNRYLTFPSTCAKDQHLTMGSNGTYGSTFRLQIEGNTRPVAKSPNTNNQCADPFAW